MIIKPRLYQETLIGGMAGALQSNRCIIGQLPTGGGKTVIFSEISHRFITRNTTSVLIIVHREELFNQTRQKLFDMHGIIGFAIDANTKHVPVSRVYVCMVESLHNRKDMFKNIPIGLLIFDECHIAVHNKILDHFQNSYCLGFTATPISTSKSEPLNKRFQALIPGPQIDELIKDGFLCQNITYAPKNSVDRTELKVKGGDFDESTMGDKFKEPKFIINTVDAYKRWAKNSKTLVFNVNKEHSKLVNEEFLKNGFNSRHLDSDMSGERKSTMEWFRNTPDAILNSVAMFTTGLDEPSIETVISNLSTLSVVKWLQMCGRGSRPTDFKSMFKIIDMGGNGVFHGDWNNNRDWLEVFNNPPKKGKNTVAPCKVCPECEALLFASVMKCEYCKYIFPRKVEGVEELLNNYVILTKNIDVEKIIVANSHKKTYYAFFQIVKKHANFFKLSGLVLTPELFKFVHERCFIDCRKWLHINGNKLSSFHKDLIIDELSKQLNYGNRILQTGN